ncbi:hypothetical protein G7013_02690 [Pseudomonas viridiflava]|uniref:Uncharacterized protein n=1 Tax=Pseudomonas viridiflava TaxID=33069 RepID=A0A3M5PJK5_PSEVI|nr:MULTISPECIES: hypothetical protein [Pseudomonas syringae group]MBA1228556.1 hypothetical protein [Pseudomonas viridiflava]MCF5705802.1 hypothetical protein [Pseudomonas syringae]RMT84216.1 hypothetical protein ALP40_02592 [Pseudomonas viridiflava]
MNIPARFEFHYVQNGVKHSVTLLTATLFKQPAPSVTHRAQLLPPPRKPGNR